MASERDKNHGQKSAGGDINLIKSAAAVAFKSVQTGRGNSRGRNICEASLTYPSWPLARSPTCCRLDFDSGRDLDSRGFTWDELPSQYQV